MMRAMLAVLAAVAVSACSDVGSPTSPSTFETTDANSSIASDPLEGPTSTTASTAAPSPAAANYETKFMTGMIDHHQMAIEMAEMCLSKATHKELRQLCESVIAAQSREIQQMQNWLQDWYSMSYSPQMSNSAQKELDRLRSLSGAEFEIMFIDMMIQHHQAAVKEGRTCLDRAYHRQLIRLCENIITSQSAEIAQMEEWLCQWYGRCGRTS